MLSRLILSAIAFSNFNNFANGYFCGPDGRLDCGAAGISDPLVIQLGGKEELKNCFYSRCPSIFVRGGELTLKNITFSNSVPINGTGVFIVENGVLNITSSNFRNTTADRGAGIFANN